MRTRRLVATLAAAAALTLTGCSDDGGSSPAAPAGAGQNQARTLTAQQLVERLTAEGLPITDVLVFDENTDPNKLMGRPGQYTSKAAFVDTRVDLDEAGSDPGDVSRGGGVEVFADESAAKARHKYVTALAQSMPILNEYTYQAGRYVVRVSRLLPPAQAAEYEAAVKRIAG